MPGSVCDTTTGLCVCIPTHYGQDCSGCRPGGCFTLMDRVEILISYCYPQYSVFIELVLFIMFDLSVIVISFSNHHVFIFKSE